MNIIKNNLKLQITCKKDERQLGFSDINLITLSQLYIGLGLETTNLLLKTVLQMSIMKNTAMI